MIDTDDLKQIERLFAMVRWAAIPMVLVLGWLHPPLSTGGAIALAIALLLANAVVLYGSRRIETLRAQQILGIFALAVDAVVAAAAIAFFIADRSTAAYAGFGLVVIEAAVRYALPGGLAMAGLFAIGLAGAMWARLVLYNVSVSEPGYVFWVLFMGMLALAVGALVRESRERQRQVHKLSADQARLEERHRLSREMHDSLLKTLHGLSLEAHSLRAVRGEAVKEKARYIQEVCARAAVDIRELIFDLRHDEAGPFMERASGIVQDWSSRTGIAVEVHCEGEDTVLPARLDYDLRQALEEGLLNVERHAKASAATVELRMGTETLEMVVHDDGAGGGPAYSNGFGGGGIGLLSVKERAEQWKGTMSFSKGDGGATLRVSIPWSSILATQEAASG